MRGEKECPLSLVQPLQALTKTSDVVFVFRRDLAPIAKAAASKRLPTERRARRGGGSAHMAQALYMQRKCTPWEVRAVKAEAGAGPDGVGEDLVLEKLGGDHDRRDQQPLPRNEQN